MTQSDFRNAEDYVRQRYVRWRTMTIPFDYKRRKGDRLVEILMDTGGLPKTALELGVGPGGVARAVSEAGPHVIGMDLSPEALLRAREHCANVNVSLLCGSGFALPFGNGTLPLVYASQVLHLFDSRGRLSILREARRVLQPGGRFVFDMKNVASHPWRYFSSSAEKRSRNFPPRSEIASLLRDAGFGKVDVKAGLFPLLGASIPSNSRSLTSLAHTRFYVARG